jgi:REP element-mobilizing transposase RayT
MQENEYCVPRIHGNRRQQTYFCDDDYSAYVELMAAWCSRSGVEVWAYCPMPNYAHLIVVPRSEERLRIHYEVQCLWGYGDT